MFLGGFDLFVVRCEVNVMRGFEMEIGILLGIQGPPCQRALVRLAQCLPSQS